MATLVGKYDWEVCRLRTDAPAGHPPDSDATSASGLIRSQSQSQKAIGHALSPTAQARPCASSTSLAPSTPPQKHRDSDMSSLLSLGASGQLPHRSRSGGSFGGRPRYIVGIQPSSDLIYTPRPQSATTAVWEWECSPSLPCLRSMFLRMRLCSG